MSGLDEVTAMKSDRINRLAERSVHHENNMYLNRIKKLEQLLRHDFAMLNLGKHTVIDRHCKTASLATRTTFLTEKQNSTFDKQQQAGTLNCMYHPTAPNFAARIRARGKQISRELVSARPDGRSVDGSWGRYLPFESNGKASEDAHSAFSRRQQTAVLASYPSPAPSRPRSVRVDDDDSAKSTVSPTSRLSSAVTSKAANNNNVWFARSQSYTADSCDYTKSRSHSRNEGRPAAPTTSDLAEIERKKMAQIIRQITIFNTGISPLAEHESDEENEFWES